MKHFTKIGTLGILSFAHFIVDFYSLFLPIFIPILVLQLGITYFSASLLISSVTLIGAVFQSPVGYWADLYRKRVTFIAIGFVFYVLGATIFGLSNGFGLLFLSSLFLGFAGATYHPQSANLIIKNFSKKGQVLGIHGAGGQLGRFISPILIAYLISRLQWRLAAVIIAVPALIAALLCWSTLKEPLERGEKGFGKTITKPILILILVLGLRAATFTGIIFFLPSFLMERTSSINTAGLLTGVMLGVGLIAQPLGGIMGDRISKIKIIFLSLTGISTLLFLFYLILMPMMQQTILNYGALVVFLVAIGFCIFITFPIGLALSAELASGERVGSAVGAVFGGEMIISALTVPALGYIIDTYGFRTGFGFLGMLAGAGAIVTGLYYISSKRNNLKNAKGL